MQNLKGRNFLKILDLSNEELKYLIKLSHNLKAQKYNGVVNMPLKGKSIALLFQKDSTRTRCAFEVGATELGMHAAYIGPSGSQFGKKESIADSARVLGRMFDGIQFRGYAHEDVENLGKYAGIPVWNGLTDDWHPTQMIADFMTMEEQLGDLRGKKIVYSGDGRNNVANSLIVTAVKLGMHFVMLSPEELFPKKWLIDECEKIAKKTSAKIELTSDWKIATKDAHIIYTDVWVSMGESDWSGRIKLLQDYQVNMDMIRNASKDVIFLHCLPAFHDFNTSIGSEKAKEFGSLFSKVKNGEFEVTNEVFESKHSKVFDQAENRLHSIKAIMLATIGQ